jgi:hypothetical protein
MIRIGCCSLWSRIWNNYFLAHKCDRRQCLASRSLKKYVRSRYLLYFSVTIKVAFKIILHVVGIPFERFELILLIDDFFAFCT